ncbi:hypothetical protein NQ318_018926 [Aromia moschata]|uniref:CUB domain-containing protein n=1 Tax=Aromia moschata TaxID=1265417 RepID=A0AAV8ZJ97_9CUCU|nr:hypothetical protein NQ318_018926 [Aromia moschata]
MGRFNYISMALASIINFFMPVSMVVQSELRFLSGHGYPSNYRPSTACRWTAHSEVGTKIIISCEEVVIPRSSSCSGDRLAVSLSGNENFTDSKNYCGTGTFSHVSEANSLTDYFQQASLKVADLYAH